MPQATIAALSWLNFDFAELDAQMSTLSYALASLKQDANVCGPAAEEVTRLQYALRAVWDRVDAATSKAAHPA